MHSIGLLSIISFGFTSTLSCGNQNRKPEPTPQDQPAPAVGNASYTVRQVASLRTARAAHTATTLLSGDVLVIGGMGEGASGIASVESFEPGNNSVHELGTLTEARAGHTATLLAEGRVLVAGGYNGEYLSSLEMFDPSAKRFRTAGSLVEGRSGHTATLLPDGRVLFAGGVGRGWTFLRTAEIYDPKTGRSESVGSMTAPREGHTATLLRDGRVLIVGGHSGRRPNVNVYVSTEIFTPGTGRFESGGDLEIARHKHDAIRLTDGRVLVIGGADFTDRVHYATTEVYDPRTGKFTRGPSMANRRYKIAGTSMLLPNGDVLVTSGAPDVELLDVDKWAFRTVAGQLPAAYRFAAAAPLSNGDVFFAGGYTDANHSATGVWRFSPK
ncbi:MAG TPA: kelch repeat-containing protein [Gemmatimonadaceae bacterium]